MTTGSSLDLGEVSRRLGASEEEVRRALQAGEFPGRFLVNGDLRVPLDEVERAQERWMHRRPVVEAEVHSDLGSQTRRRTVSAIDLEELRTAILSILREERRSVFETLLVPLEKSEDRLSRLEDEVREVRRGIQALGAGGHEHEREAGSRWSGLDDDGGGSRVDVRGLVREIADLEAMLSDFDDD